jgi:aspartyl-tRNA(Asn)/glutamyl-tRNA(Gln) amidotransferase subunit B
VDANVSVRRRGSGGLATKTELKNMNSFRGLERALAFEAARQVAALESGGTVERQTMLWDADRGSARPLRGKEEVEDYRYFPEPDLPALELPEDLVERTVGDLPELPWARRQRLVDEHGIPEYDAEVLTSMRELADYYEAVAAAADPKVASNWVMGVVLSASNERGVGVGGLGVPASAMAELIGLVEGGTLSENLGKRVFERMLETGEPASRIVEAEGLRKISAAERIAAWVDEVVEENEDEVKRYRAGERKLLGYFIGQVMQKSDGRADPEAVRSALVGAIGD